MNVPPTSTPRIAIARNYRGGRANAYEPAALVDIEAARQRIADTVVRTPLVRLEIDAPAEIFLKLENLQPIGSFKLRGAGNAIAPVDSEALTGGLRGGGLSCGIASALRALVPACRVYACGVETAAPLEPSLEAGEPVEVEHVASFVDGIGAPTVFPEMFALASGHAGDGKLVCVVSGGNIDTSTLATIMARKMP